MLRKRNLVLALLFILTLFSYALAGIASASQQTPEQNMSQESSMEDLLLWLTGPAEPGRPGDSLSRTFAPAETKTRVAVFVEIGETKVIKINSKVMEVIEAKLNDFFPPDKFSVLPLNETNQALIDYKDDEGMIIDEFNSTRASRGGVLEVCNNIGEVDYAFSIYLSHDHVKYASGLLAILPLPIPTNFQMNVTCDTRLLDVVSGKFVSWTQAMKVGNALKMVFAPDVEDIFCSGLSRALDAIEIDTSGINPQ